MKCFCGQVALRYVGRDGFCGSHLREAWRAAAQEKRAVESESAVLRFDDQMRLKHERAMQEGWRDRA